MWVFGAGRCGGRVHLRGHDDGLRLVPEGILAEDEVGQVLGQTGSLQDLDLWTTHTSIPIFDDVESTAAPLKSDY